jgi:glycosyltransferase involved in cell wall biosynthesis
MRVCMLAYAFYENDTRIKQYVSALLERGCSVDVIALRRAGQRRYEFLDGVHVHRIQQRVVDERGRLAYFTRIARFLIRSGISVARQHFAKPYDLVHVHSVPDFLAFAALIPKLLGAAVVLDIHDVLPELYSSKFQLAPNSTLFKALLWAEKVSVAFSDHTIIANHIWQQRLLSRSARPDEVTTIRNYPDLTIFARPLNLARDARPFIATYPGTLNSHQGLDTAIKAIARVKDQMPDLEFHIYGEGPAKPALIDLVSQLDLESVVFFHDFLPTSQIAEVMARSDLGIEPKSASSPFGDEALSTKILEFMALGVPVIASRTTVHRYYYPDTVVQYFQSDNDLELSQCILRLYRDAQLRKQFVERAAKHVLENNWGVRKAEYLALVDQLVAARQKIKPRSVIAPGAIGDPACKSPRQLS